MIRRITLQEEQLLLDERVPETCGEISRDDLHESKNLILE